MDVTGPGKCVDLFTTLSGLTLLRLMSIFSCKIILPLIREFLDVAGSFRGAHSPIGRHFETAPSVNSTESLRLLVVVGGSILSVMAEKRFNANY